MEHLNRLLKTCISNLGANKTPAVIVRFGKCIGPMSAILDSFHSEHVVKREPGITNEQRLTDLKLLTQRVVLKSSRL